MKILVVDDDFRQRDLYLELFKSKGYEVLPANDGLEGLEIALKEKPNLVFTGIMMPRMDGFEFIRNLRNNVATSETPVIMFSHLGREEDRQKSRKFYNVEFMVKGFDSPNEILKRAEELMKGKIANPKPETIPDDQRLPRTTI